MFRRETKHAIPGTNVISLSLYSSSLPKLYQKSRKNPAHFEEIKQSAEPDPGIGLDVETIR